MLFEPTAEAANLMPESVLGGQRETCRVERACPHDLDLVELVVGLLPITRERRVEIVPERPAQLADLSFSGVKEVADPPFRHVRLESRGIEDPVGRLLEECCILSVENALQFAEQLVQAVLEPVQCLAVLGAVE